MFNRRERCSSSHRPVGVSLEIVCSFAAVLCATLQWNALHVHQHVSDKGQATALCTKINGHLDHEWATSLHAHLMLEDA